MANQALCAFKNKKENLCKNILTWTLCCHKNNQHQKVWWT